MFGASELHSAVEKALTDAAVPAGSRGAFVVVATPSGVAGVVSVRVNDVWSVESVVEMNATDHRVEGGVSVKAVW